MRGWTGVDPHPPEVTAEARLEEGALGSREGLPSASERREARLGPVGDGVRAARLSRSPHLLFILALRALGVASAFTLSALCARPLNDAFLLGALRAHPLNPRRRGSDGHGAEIAHEHDLLSHAIRFPLELVVRRSHGELGLDARSLESFADLHAGRSRAVRRARRRGVSVNWGHGSVSAGRLERHHATSLSSGGELILIVP